MCGRISIAVSMDLLAVRFNVKPSKQEFNPRYNVAPMQNIPVVLDSRPDRIYMCRWGFMPHWSKDESNCLINARAETIAERSAFMDSFKNRRCLVLADGFYEWQTVKEKKVPYRFLMKDKNPFAIAGLWNNTGNIISIVIVTIESNKIVKPIHKRMPVILDSRFEKEWITQTDSSKLFEIMAPFPSDSMEYYMVGDSVNNPDNDSPEIIKPSPQRTLF
jgi:putative SOS response-associated peptidase YedK